MYVSMCVSEILASHVVPTWSCHVKFMRLVHMYVHLDGCHGDSVAEVFSQLLVCFLYVVFTAKSMALLSRLRPFVLIGGFAPC